MKISLNVEADSINVLALNMGKIAVEVDGVDIETLLNVVNDNGYTFRIADVPGQINVENSLPPTTRLVGIQCSTAHITEGDNQLLYELSQQSHEMDILHWLRLSAAPGCLAIPCVTAEMPRAVKGRPQATHHTDTSLFMQPHPF